MKKFHPLQVCCLWVIVFLASLTRVLADATTVVTTHDLADSALSISGAGTTQVTLTDFIVTGKQVTTTVSVGQVAAATPPAAPNGGGMGLYPDGATAGAEGSLTIAAKNVSGSIVAFKVSQVCVETLSAGDYYLDIEGIAPNGSSLGKTRLASSGSLNAFYVPPFSGSYVKSFILSFAAPSSTIPPGNVSLRSFTVTAAVGYSAAVPTVTSISPTSGFTTGGTSVTITGTNLGSAFSADFGSSSATIGSNTSTQIVATSPAGSAGTVHVTVTTAGGTSATSASDQFTYAANTAPTFVGATTTLSVNENSGATSILGLLHVSDADSSQTETWTQKTAPSHGTLSFSSATASSGSTDITSGGTITYTPTTDYAGSDSFEVQVSDGTATASRTITVTVNPVATKLAFSTQPSGSVSGIALTTQPVVRATDVNGNVDTSFTGNITLAVSTGAGSLTGTTTVAAVAGVATFTDLVYRAASDPETFALTTSNTASLTNATSSTTSSNVVATKLVFSTQPAPTTVVSTIATSFTTVPVVRAVDADGTVDVGYGTAVALSVKKSDGSAVPGTVNSFTGTGDTDGVATTVTLTPSSGVATFTGLALTYTNSAATDSIALYASSGSLTTVLSSTITSVEDAKPVVTTSGGTTTFTEGGGAVVIDSGLTISDSDNTTLATVVVTISANFQSGSDVLSFTNDGSTMGNISGSYNGTTGVLTLSSSGATAIIAEWQAALRVVKFNNTSTDPSTSSRTVSFVANDGIRDSTAATMTVSVAAKNGAPSLSASAENPTFTENGSAVVLFDTAAASTDESAQTILELKLTVSGLADGASEKLTTLGSTFSLTNGTTGTTSTSSVDYSVSVTGDTATVTFSKTGGVASSVIVTLVNGLSYSNISEAPTTTSRVVTLTSIKDDGGTVNSGVDTTTVSIASTVAVSAVNDAPTLAGGPYSLTGTNENTTSGATLVSTILAGVTYADVDASPSSGIAITAKAGNGTWQYSTDGVTWNGFGTVSSASALLLSSTSSVRYVPDSLDGETATFTFRAWDQTSGTASTNSTQNTADTSTNGGTTAYSTGTAQASIVVAAINDPPTLTATAANPTFTEDGSAVTLFSSAAVSTIESGQTISKLILTVSDVADGASEILTVDGRSISLTNGASGTTIVNVLTYAVSVSSGTATVTLDNGNLSAAAAQTLINGITYTNSSNAPTTSPNRVVTLTSIKDNGGTSNGGVDTTTLSIASTVTVSAVNDAPTLAGGPYSLTTTDEDTTSGATLVSTILAGVTYADADASPSSGIAITAKTGNGTWQYSTDATTWNAFGTVTANAALLLTSTTSVRYVPDAQNGETATFTFRAWDQTSGTASTNSTQNTADTSTNGGTTAFSTGTANASLTVTAVNDIPVVTTSGGTTAFTEGNNVVSTAVVIDSSLTVTDVDNTTLASATVSITGNFKTAEDVLSFTNDGSTMGNIAGSYTSGTGVFALASAGQTATKAQWQAALRAVKYTNASETPDTSDRTISFVVNDGTADSAAATKTVSVAAVDDTPTNVALSNASVAQSGGANAVVGALSSTDADSSSFTYTLVSGSGDTNNALFNISGSNLRATNAASIAAGSYSVRVQTSDGTSSYAKAFTITATDDVAPGISSVTGPADGSYKAAQNLDITVNFSEAVTVSTVGGTPSIDLTVGAAMKNAAYLSGSGTSALVFRYVVAGGDTDTDGIAVVSPLKLNSGTIVDAVSNPPTSLAFTPPTTTGVLVDTTAPTLTTVSIASNNANTAKAKTGDTVTVTFVASENLQTPTATIAGHAASISGSAKNWTASYVMASGDTEGTVVFSISFQDIAGNAGTAVTATTDSSAVVFDRTPPTVHYSCRKAGSFAANSATSAVFTVYFSEQVTGVDASDFAVTALTGTVAGTVSNVTAGANFGYEVTVSSITGVGMLRLDLNSSGTGIKDAASNAIETGYTYGESYTKLTGISVPFAWGQDVYGQLGNASTTNSSVPVATVTSGLLVGKTIVAVSSGNGHTLALDSTGSVFAWGRYERGQLGNGQILAAGEPSGQNRSLETSAAYQTSPIAVDSSDVLSGKTVVAIASGSYHNLVLTSDGKLYSWGANTSGQLGNGANTDQSHPVAVDMSGVLSGKTIMRIACGSAHSIAIDSEGKVYAWGDNTLGQLGNATYTASNVPVAVDTTGVLSGNGIVAVSAVSGSSIALSYAGRVYAWGDGAKGELGNGVSVASNIPVSVDPSGALSGKWIVQIASGLTHTLALASDGTVYGWGFNSSSQLGNGLTATSNVPVAVDTTGVLSGKTVIAIGCGSGHSFALCSDGVTCAWGANAYGQLGDNTTTLSAVPVAVVASGALNGYTVRLLSPGIGGGHSVVVATMPNVTPTFVGATTTLTVAANASATDIKSLLHVSDTDVGQTETWTQSVAPTHGSLSITGATATSGTTDITPGGTITYAPTAGYSGSDTFTVQVSDSYATATRAITVTITAPPTPPSKTTPTITWATPASITYGTALSSVQLNATASVPGSFAYSPSAGTVLDAGTRTLSVTFTPTDTSTYNTASASVSIVVTPVITQSRPLITSPLTASGAIGRSFLYRITTDVVADSFGASGLPSGLSIQTSTGHISGTPEVSGTFQVGLSATNAGGTDNKTLVLTILPALPSINSAAAANGRVGTAFSYQITASNSPTAFGASGLPVGLAVNPTTGLISGTPTTAGSSTVTLSATNAAGSTQRSLVIYIEAALTAPTYSGSSLLSGTKGSTFSVSLAFTGATSYALVNLPDGTASKLPAGLSLDAGTGALTGTATEVGTFKFAIQASNASASATLVFTITINPSASAPSITSAQSASGTVGSAFSFQLTASPAATSFAATPLPSWLSLNTTTGLLTGTALEPSAVSLTVSASNASGQGPTGTLSIVIYPKLDTPVISSSASAIGTVGAAFSYQIVASGSPTSYGLVSGTLPTGLSLNVGTGLIAGVPQTAGESVVFVAGTNANGRGESLELHIRIQPSAAVPVITSNTTVVGQVGQAFLYVIEASNSPTSYSATGLPTGLSLDASTGAITGIPVEAAVSSVTLGALNSVGPSQSRTLVITINPAPSTPVITSATEVSGTVGQSFSYAITATQSPTSYLASGLPEGLSLDSSSGVISGKPVKAGVSTAILKASNSAGLGSATSLLITVLPAAQTPTITSSASAKGKMGTAFSYTIVATPGPIQSYNLSGSLPSGLSFNTATGVISGTPTEPGLFTLVLTASSLVGTSSEQSFALTITKSDAVPVIVSSTTAAGKVGAAFSYQISATNMPSSTPYRPPNALDAASLPSGLAVNPSTGLIEGTPTEAGTFVVGLAGTNEAGSGPVRTLTVTVQSALAAPRVTSASIVRGRVGSPFSYTIQASGSPTSFETLGAPAWMTIDNGSGVLAGIPTEPGSITLQVFARNAAGLSTPLTLVVSVESMASVPIITSSQTVFGRLGSSFSYTIVATNKPQSYQITGLPAGLSFNASTGVITGTPSASGRFTATMQVSNASGSCPPTPLIFVIQPKYTLIVP